MSRVKILAFAGFAALLLWSVLPHSVNAQKQNGALKVAHISDTHLGLSRAPQATENLQRAVEMINQRQPDVIVVSGDIGERPPEWQRARQILSDVKAPVIYVPGNHDVNTKNVERFREYFGKDYFTTTIKHVTFVGLDSQLLGNYDEFSAREVRPLPEATQRHSEHMLDWLRGEARQARRAGDRRTRGGGQQAGKVIVAVQHIPFSSADGFPPDTKPYWVAQEPYRSRAMELLKEMGVKHILAGHWHKGVVFEDDGFVTHVAPALSWLPFGGKLGFAMHTISTDGKVETEFVDIE